MSKVVVIGRRRHRTLLRLRARALGGRRHRLGQRAAWQRRSLGSAGWVTQMLSAPLPAPGLVGTSLKWMLRGDSPLYIKPWADSGLPKWLWNFWRHCNRRDHETGLKAMAALTEHTMTLYDQLAKEWNRIRNGKSRAPLRFHERRGAAIHSRRTPSNGKIRLFESARPRRRFRSRTPSRPLPKGSWAVCWSSRSVTCVRSS